MLITYDFHILIPLLCVSTTLLYTSPAWRAGLPVATVPPVVMNNKTNPTPEGLPSVIIDPPSEINCKTR
jgi:hypothetical protein